MPRRAGERKPPITVERIVEAALELVASEGYQAVSMRAIAARLGTGQSSLYAHLPHKLALDRTLVSRLWSTLPIPDPNPATWQHDLVQLYVAQADLVGRHPGIEHAYLVSMPTDPAMLRFIERTFALYAAGGLSMQDTRRLEPTLEAIALVHGMQTAAIRRRSTALATGTTSLLDQAIAEDAGAIARHPLLKSYLGGRDIDHGTRSEDLATRLHDAIAIYERKADITT